MLLDVTRAREMFHGGTAVRELFWGSYQLWPVPHQVAGGPWVGAFTLGPGSFVPPGHLDPDHMEIGYRFSPQEPDLVAAGRLMEVSFYGQRPIRLPYVEVGAVSAAGSLFTFHDAAHSFRLDVLVTPDGHLVIPKDGVLEIHPDQHHVSFWLANRDIVLF